MNINAFIDVDVEGPRVFSVSFPSLLPRLLHETKIFTRVVRRRNYILSLSLSLNFATMYVLVIKAEFNAHYEKERVIPEDGANVPPR